MDFKIDQIKVIELCSKNIEGAEEEFFKRIWGTNISDYILRLKSLKIERKFNVLDAGCGYGQWSVSLSFLNTNVFSVDNDPKRIEILSKITDFLNIKNISSYVGSISAMKYDDNFFDEIFCYSTIFFTDFKKTLDEFYRILRPGGKIYVQSNGLGWYIYNLVNGHNPSKYFDSKLMAKNAIENTINYFESGSLLEGKQIIIPSYVLRENAIKSGFRNLLISGDGKIKLNENIVTKSFYKEKYFGEEGPYEMIGWKNL